jgi:predicted DNA-binding protein (MmcQ/YjbR family)
VATSSLQKLIDFALALPGAHEDHPWDEVVAKVGTKVFVFFGGDQSSGMSVKLTDAMLHEHALTLKGAQPTGYGLGKSGWVSIPLRGNSAKLGLLMEFIEESYRAIAPKKMVAELDSELGASHKSQSL